MTYFIKKDYKKTDSVEFVERRMSHAKLTFRASPRVVSCKDCEGTGFQKVTGYDVRDYSKPCMNCGGDGRYVYEQTEISSLVIDSHKDDVKVKLSDYLNEHDDKIESRQWESFVVMSPRDFRLESRHKELKEMREKLYQEFCEQYNRAADEYRMMDKLSD